jgi:glucose-1-phosphate cytidylyltransferase
MTYGDGVGDIDIASTLDFHQQQGRLATVTAVQPPGRFGRLGIDGDRVARMEEKPHGDGAWINGGFFVLSPKVFDYIGGDETLWEHEPLEQLALDDELSSFKHQGFWHPMDTLRDKNYLEELWSSGRAPWKVWD